MWRFLSLPILFFCFVFLQSCNTMYNFSSVKLEILVPSKIVMPPDFKKAAIRYNNCNVSQNPILSYYLEDDKKLPDTINTDSIASEIYFKVFVGHLKNQMYLDTVIEIEPANYSNIVFNDSLVYLHYAQHTQNDTIDTVGFTPVNYEILSFSKMLNHFADTTKKNFTTKYLDTEYGLYSKNDIEQIADTTGADLLISLDWFAALDGIFSLKYSNELNDSLLKGNANYRVVNFAATEAVHIMPVWNFYDLKKQELIFSYRKKDTIKWEESAYKLNEAKRVLPPRQDAIYNAADIAGTNFVEFLIPHWMEVERMYYNLGQIEMKKADELVKQNRWLEAAEIWKKNISNKNKKTAAKSMYNMALACEVNGQMDAAIDWAVKSFYTLQNKDELHSQNCQNYIRVLGKRKLDIKRIEGGISLY